uniref:Uncharacterized protein n=1 Tax=Hyaloperonospora arabidopsidis (strain Emoy2) TaxID=559515 RepID=M4BIY6_HYAAE
MTAEGQEAAGGTYEVCEATPTRQSMCPPRTPPEHSNERRLSTSGARKMKMALSLEVPAYRCKRTSRNPGRSSTEETLSGHHKVAFNRKEISTGRRRSACRPPPMVPLNDLRPGS